MFGRWGSDHARMTVLTSALRRASLLVSAFGTLLALLVVAAPTSAETAVATPLVQYSDVLRTFNPQLSLTQSKDVATHVLLLSSYYGLDPRLLVAIVGVESSWRSGAVSSAGAQGLGQLMPATAGVLNVLAFDTYENLDGTARYLRRMMQQYAGLPAATRDVRAIASYNAGPAAVARAGGIPPFAETRAYVTRVMGLWHRLQAQLPGSAPLLALTHATTLKPIVIAHAHTRPRTRAPYDSVADFTQLDLRSMRTLALAQPDPPKRREPRGLRRWFLRAFGSSRH